MSRREVGRWPDDVVVKLTPGDDARLAIEGEHPDLTLEFRRADGTALPALAPTDVSVERTLWALSAVEVAGLAGVTSAAFRRRETTLMAGPVWWRDRWRGWGAGTDGAVRLVEGPRGKPGHTPVLTWDGTVLEIDGEPGPDLQGPPGSGGGGDGAALSNASPQALAASAAPGTAGEASRADHVHPLPTPGDIGAATAAQGLLADSAVQPGDLAPVATSGSYGDLTGTPTIPATPEDVGAQPAGSYVLEGDPRLADIKVNVTDFTDFTEATQDVVGAMVTGAGGTYDDAAGTITLPSGGGSSTITADDTPAAPAEGASASYLVTSAVSWPAGLVWSTDPDGDTAPTITGTALVSLFTLGGVTYAVLGATFQAASGTTTTTTTAEGGTTTTTTTAATTTTTTTNTAPSMTLGAPTITDLGVSQPFTTSDANGDPVTVTAAWGDGNTGVVTSPATHTYAAANTYAATFTPNDGKTNGAVRNASYTVTAPAPPVGAPATLAEAVVAYGPAGYWKLNETSGTTITDYSGNGRHGTLAGMAGTDFNYNVNGFLQFLTSSGYVSIPDDDVFTIGAAGMTVFGIHRLTTDTSGARTFVAKDSATNQLEWRVQRSFWGMSASAGNASGSVAAYQSNSGNIAPTNLTAWKGVAVTFPLPGGTDAPRFYLGNSTPVGTKAFNSGVYANRTSPVTIGTNFLGAIGHVAIFPWLLTTAHIAKLMDLARSEGLIV